MNKWTFGIQQNNDGDNGDNDNKKMIQNQHVYNKIFSCILLQHVFDIYLLNIIQLLKELSPFP